MGQRNKAEVGGDTRDINVCRVDECNHDLSQPTIYSTLMHRTRTTIACERPSEMSWLRSPVTLFASAAVLLILLRMLSPPVHFSGVLQARLALPRQTGSSRSSGPSAEHSLCILIANFFLFLCREIEFLKRSECLRESELRKV